jgi:hypothetical protein
MTHKSSRVTLYRTLLSNQLVCIIVSSGLLRRVALVRTTRRNNPENTILHSNRRENLKSYNLFVLFGLTEFHYVKSIIFWGSYDSVQPGIRIEMFRGSLRTEFESLNMQ